MMNKKEAVIVRSLLAKVVAASKEMETLEGSNPQIVEMRKRAKAERVLAEAVIDAMGGDLVSLKLYSVGK